MTSKPRSGEIEIVHIGCSCGHHQALAAAEEKAEKYRIGWGDADQKAERYRKALEDILKHYTICAPTSVTFSTICTIARAALEEK